MTLRERLRHAWRAFGRFCYRVTAWFGPVATSLHGRINGEEAKRIATRVAITAASAGSVWAGITHATHDPEVISAFVGLAAVALGAVFEGIHRYHDGQKPHDVVPPVPLPEPPE